MADPLSSESGMRADDRRLGIDRPIARRDFLNGVAIAAGAIAGGMLPGVMTEGEANEAAARARGQPGEEDRHRGDVSWERDRRCW